MKRALFLALLLANLGLFAWVRWYALPAHEEPAPAPTPGGKPLQLMSELSPSERKSVAAKAAPAAATMPVVAVTLAPAPSPAPGALGFACASYGPFPSSDAATQALTRINGLGLTGSEHMVAGRAKRGYWVFLPPFGSRKEADAAADMLRKRGVKDIYVVTDEANRNAISLGVFNQKEGAIQREKDIRKLGLRPQVADRFRETPQYWIEGRGTQSALPSADLFKDLAEDSAPIGKATALCAG